VCDAGGGADRGAGPRARRTAEPIRSDASASETPGVDDADLHRWICTQSGLRFGQCILERPPGRSWVHVSICGTRDPKRCGEALTFDGKSYKPWKP